GIPRDAWTMWRLIGPLFMAVFFFWAASPSCRFFFEARRGGLFEVLFLAPVGGGEIINGHLRGVLWVFALPGALIVGVHVMASVFSEVEVGRMMGRAGGILGGSILPLAVATGAATLVTALGNLLTLTWFGMWMGLTSKSANWATLKTFLFIQII